MFKQILKDTAIYGMGDFVLKLLAFFTFPIFTNIFNVNEYGLLNLIATVVGVGSIIAGGGVNNAVQRYYFDPHTKDEERPQIISSGLLVIFVWSAFVTLLLSATGLVMNHYHFLDRFEIPINLLLIALATIIPVLLLSYSQDTLRLHFAPWRFFTVAFIKNILGVLLSLVLIVYLGFHLNGFFLGTLIALGVSVPLALYLIRKDLTLKFSRDWSKEIVRFGFPFIYMGLAYWLFQSFDSWMLAYMTDNTQVGLYSTAARIASIIFFVSAAFGQAWSPLAIKIMKDYPTDYMERFKNIAMIWFPILCLVAMGITVFGKDLLVILTPEAYWGAYPVLVYLSISAVFMGSTQLTALGISISKKTRIFIYTSWGAAILNCVLNLFFIKLFGAQGAAISTCITYFILTASYLYFSKKLIGLHFNNRQIVALLLLMFLVSALGLFLNQFNLNLWLSLLIKSGIYIGIVLLCFVAKILQINQLKATLAMLGAKFGKKENGDQ